MKSPKGKGKKEKDDDGNNNSDEEADALEQHPPSKPPRRTRSTTRRQSQVAASESQQPPLLSSSTRRSRSQLGRPPQGPSSAQSNTTTTGGTPQGSRNKAASAMNRRDDAGGDSDAATAGGLGRGRGRHGPDDNDSEEEESDPQLQRLLNRLQREHATNFGKDRVGSIGANNRRGSGQVNRTRARYLLEASAGNVGLASALYWEDYLAEAEGGDMFREMGGPAVGAGAAAGAGGGGAAGSVASAASASSVSSTAAVAGGAGAGAVSAGRRSFGSPKDLPKYGKRSSPLKKRKSSGGADDFLDDDGHSAKKQRRDLAYHAGVKARFDSRAKSDYDPSNRDVSGSSSNRDSAGSSGFASSNVSRRHGSTLSSMHQFQQDLDEKISSLQERLSSYRSRLSNDDAAGTANAERSTRSSTSSGNAASDEASMQASVASMRRAASARAAADISLQAAGAAGGAPSNPSVARRGSGNDNDAAAAAAALAEYPNLWRMGLEGYPGGLGGISPSRYPMLFGGMYAAYGAARSRGAVAPAAGGAESAAAGAGETAISRGRQDFTTAMNEALRSAGSHRTAAGDAAAALRLDAAALRLNRMQRCAGAEGARPYPFDFLSRALANNPGGGGGRQLDEAEARALMAALAADPALSAAAGAGGAGGDDDDGDDDDSHGNDNAGDDVPRRDEREQESNDANRNARDDAAAAADNNAAGGAPLRRSMRLRSARSRAARNPPARNLPRNNNDDDEDTDELPPPDLVANHRRVPRPARPPAVMRGRGSNASVDVSDDDDVTFMPGPVPVFRLKKGKVGGAESLLSNLSGKRKKPEPYDDSDDENSDDELVDIDLLLHSSDAFSEPSTELWGSYPRHSGGDSDESGDDGDNADNGRTNIPISWLRSGFMLSKCGNGLAVSGPSDDEWDRHRRSQPHALRDGPLKGVKGLFPYNCQGVPALLSIVTALLYSGASIQGGSTVTCDADRVPFDELSLEQRKREFDPRLVDALSSLIFNAAQAGSRRCEEKLAKYDKHWARRRKGHVSPEEEDVYTTKRLALQRRARVCHVCWWETDTANGNATIYPEGKDPKDVNFKTSFTNIHDLKSYVKTHLRSFKEPGGCALLLETILHCHGPYMTIPPTSLLKCRCTESLKHLGTSGKNKNGIVSMMSEEHDCMTTELLSLLLTGEIHSTYENWSADGFGIGLLRMGKNNTAPVGNRLLRPVKPIWICFGDFGYSTLFLEMKDFIGSMNSLEEPGKAFQLAHWNCWSGVRTGFRVITSMHDKEPYNVGQQSFTATISDSEQEGRTVTESISTRLNIEQKRDAAMPWRHDRMTGAARVNPDLKPIADEELQSVSFHPEDEKYYPGLFRRWRFHFGSTASSNSSMSIDAAWIPFYRLRGRQRLIVEMKLAPRICAIIRSRWPLATVRDFSPAGKFPVV